MIGYLITANFDCLNKCYNVSRAGLKIREARSTTAWLELPLVIYSAALS